MGYTQECQWYSFVGRLLVCGCYLSRKSRGAKMNLFQSIRSSPWNSAIWLWYFSYIYATMVLAWYQPVIPVAFAVFVSDHVYDMIHCLMSVDCLQVTIQGYDAQDWVYTAKCNLIWEFWMLPGWLINTQHFGYLVIKHAKWNKIQLFYLLVHYQQSRWNFLVFVLYK
jgi:hypothetical protein